MIRSTVMSRLALWSLVFGTLVLTACSHQDLLFISDQYWQATVLDSSRFKDGLANLSSARGVRAKTIVVPYTSADSAKLVGAIGENEGATVVLSPLYSPEAETLAAQFPDRRIVVFSATVPTKVRLSNVVYLVSDPTAVFKSAAKRVSERLSVRNSGGDVPAVAGVFSDDSEGRRAMSGFRAGLETASVRPELYAIQVSGEADRSRLRSFLDDSAVRNVGIYLLAAPALNAYAVELLKNNASPIVTENWNFGATYSGKVIFSLDKDIPSALMKVVETMGRPSDNEIRIPWSIVTGRGGS